MPRHGFGPWFELETPSLKKIAMKSFYWAPLSFLVFLVIAVSPLLSGEDSWVELIGEKPLEAWKSKTTDWLEVGAVTLDPVNPKLLKGEPGKGILLNGAKGRVPDLLTKQNYGDFELHVEFLLAKNSNSGVKFHGHYEIQFQDTHGLPVEKLTGDHCGGIYPRAELKPKYHHIDKGIAPRVNAAKPAGEWQTLNVVFRAPSFDSAGKKTANAKIVRAVLNGQVIHENQELETPTGNLWKNAEVTAGPLLFQGDHGPVAFRNLRVRPIANK